MTKRYSRNVAEKRSKYDVSRWGRPHERKADSHHGALTRRSSRYWTGQSCAGQEQPGCTTGLAAMDLRAEHPFNSLSHVRFGRFTGWHFNAPPSQVLA